MSLKKPSDYLVIRGEKVFLRIGRAEVEVTQVYQFALETERHRIKEIKIVPLPDDCSFPSTYQNNN